MRLFCPQSVQNSEINTFSVVLLFLGIYAWKPIQATDQAQQEQSEWI